MWSAFDISASGLAASAARLSTAASHVAKAFTGGSAPNVPPPQPASSASPAAAPVAGLPASGATAVAAQQQASDEPASWMVEVLNARTAYRANAAVMKVAEKMADETINTIA